MSEDQALSLEEAFVENNFDLGEDADTVTQNYNIASSLYQKYYEQVNGLVEDILDGLVVDVSSAVFAIQNLCLAQKYRDMFQKEKTISVIRFLKEDQNFNVSNQNQGGNYYEQSNINRTFN